jgi:thiol-disulfide isomerase/thioredoxin
MSLHFLARNTFSVGFALLLGLGIANCSQTSAQEPLSDSTRVWRDSSGKFEVTAKLQSQNQREVLLLTESGKEIRVKKSRLSEDDLRFLKTLSKKSDNQISSKGSENNDSSSEKKTEDSESETDRELLATLRASALKFYDDLRTTERAVAIELLTPPARELAKANQSAFSSLPKPDDGKQSIRVGKPTVKDKEASIPVTVRVNKKNLKTIIYFAKDDQDQWSVAAIGSVVKNEEAKINFAEPNIGEEKDTIASLVGQPIELTGLTLDGSPVSLETLKGKVVLIDFWATWCGPCIAEIPNVLENYEKYHDAGFEVVAVSTDKDLEALADFVKEENPPWIVLADRHPKNKNSMAKKFGITGIPTFILVDRDGKVCAVNCRGKKLGEKLEELFASNVNAESE